MPKIKDIDSKILFELMKNSKTSDRKLAKKIGVSQPTITRRRARLEKEAIDGYTAIPRWEKLGYNILAIILVKARHSVSLGSKRKEALDRSLKWLDKQPNVIMAGRCRGMGMSGFMVSVHKSYVNFDNFMEEHISQLGDILEDVQTVIVNLSGEGFYRPLHVKYLAEAK